MGAGRLFPFGDEDRPKWGLSISLSYGLFFFEIPTAKKKSAIEGAGRGFALLGLFPFRPQGAGGNVPLGADALFREAFPVSCQPRCSLRADKWPSRMALCSCP